jgi:hypothetical protein
MATNLEVEKLRRVSTVSSNARMGSEAKIRRRDLWQVTYESVPSVLLPRNTLFLLDRKSASRAFQSNRSLERVKQDPFHGDIIPKLLCCDCGWEKDSAGRQGQVCENTQLAESHCEYVEEKNGKEKSMMFGRCELKHPDDEECRAWLHLQPRHQVTWGPRI